MIWIVFAIVTACAILAVARPLGSPAARASGAASEIEAYKAQLAELDREEERGEIGKEEAEQTRTEMFAFAPLPLCRFRRVLPRGRVRPIVLRLQSRTPHRMPAQLDSQAGARPQDRASRHNCKYNPDIIARDSTQTRRESTASIMPAASNIVKSTAARLAATRPRHLNATLSARASPSPFAAPVVRTHHLG